MNSKKRKQNETEFDFWEETDNGGRKYWLDVKGKLGGYARYVKTVDEQEITVSFVQEIYNSKNELTEIHEKYPIDKGHKKIIQ